MKKGLRVPLRQPWLGAPQKEFSPGFARLGMDGKILLAHFMLKDDQPRNRAIRRNEKTWASGDVVEVFLQQEGGGDYYEFHLTPENQRLQLHFPRIGRNQPWETFTVEEDLFESRTHISASRKRWQCLLRIDLAALFGSVPARVRFLLGRYDAQTEGTLPILSCSGKLTVCDFHRLAEWSVAEIISPRV